MSKVNWSKVKNEYVNGNKSLRKLAEKYGVSFKSVSVKCKEEEWVKLRKAQREKTSAKIIQKTADKIADTESEKMLRITLVTDKLLTKIEQAVEELGYTVIRNKTQVKKGETAPVGSGGEYSETLRVVEDVDKAQSVIDVQRIRQITASLKDIAEITTMTHGYGQETDNAESDIVTALREAFKESQSNADK